MYPKRNINMMKRLLLLTTLCVVVCSCRAQVGTKFEAKDIYGNKLEYEITSNKKVKLLRNYKAYKRITKVKVPASVEFKGNTYEVSELDKDGVFAGCEKLTEAELPNTIKVLPNGGEKVSEWNHDRKTFVVKYYTQGVFDDCSSLVKVVLPSSIMKLGNQTFRGCSSLHNVTLPPQIKEIGNFTFLHCTSLETIVIPSMVESIGEMAFKDCTSLEIVSLPEGLKNIGQSAFSGCSSIVNIIIPNSVQYIYMDTFVGCSSLQNVILPDKAGYQHEKSTFYHCNNLTNIKYHNGKIPSYRADIISSVSDCPFFLNEGRLEDPDFDKKLLADPSYVSKPVVEEAPKPSAPIIVDHSIDQNIPANTANNTNTFAVIIGNEKYQQVMTVPYANNDARIFAEYCKKTLGLPEKNVKLYENATFGAIIGAVSDIQKIAKAFKGDINVIFYYAGHGIPDEATGDGYLLPIDADGLKREVCYPLARLYRELSELQAHNVTVFLDACFSGAQRGNGMVVAARGVAIKAKTGSPKGNVVVFSAATDKQTAFPYEEKGHGMFTYYILKKLRDTKGDCTLGELGKYICCEVAKQAVVTNGKEQTPVVHASSEIVGNWETIKLK